MSNAVAYICERCKQPFLVAQGSRRKLCGVCVVERKREGGSEGRRLQLSKPTNGSH